MCLVEKNKPGRKFKKWKRFKIKIIKKERKKGIEGICEGGFSRRCHMQHIQHQTCEHCRSSEARATKPIHTRTG